MSLRKKSSHKQTILMCVLLALVMVVFVYVTDDGTSAPAGAPDISVETPAETGSKEPTAPTPAIVGGVAAIAVYYLGSVAISARKKRKKDDKKKDK